MNPQALIHVYLHEIPMTKINLHSCSSKYASSQLGAFGDYGREGMPCQKLFLVPLIGGIGDI